MLENIDALDWSSLQGCNHSGTEIPAFLRALTSSSPDEREWARSELWSTIIHQGTVYEVTGHVVPFLYELLDGEGVPEKDQLAFLLATVASGDSYLAVHVTRPDEVARMDAIAAKKGTTFASALSRELAHVARMKKEIVARFDLLYPYLRDPDAQVRLAVAESLGCYPEVVCRLRSDLQRALTEETDEYVRGALQRVLDSGSDAAP